MTAQQQEPTMREEIAAALRDCAVWWADDTDGPADAVLAVLERRGDDDAARVRRVADELDEDSRSALDQADIADMRGDLAVRRIYVRHARVAKHAASAIRRALDGDDTGSGQ